MLCLGFIKSLLNLEIDKLSGDMNIVLFYHFEPK